MKPLAVLAKAEGSDARVTSNYFVALRSIKKGAVSSDDEPLLASRVLC